MNRRILLVDDHADFQEGVRQVLAPHYEVTLAQSGAEALAKSERHGPFAVIVSDYAMPGMTGIELLSEMATAWPDTARILLTGCADLGLALEALERGAIFRFLTKPTDSRRLLDAVGAGMARYHDVEEERAFTEQLSFARESLQTLNGALEARLENEIAHLDRLARGSEQISAADSLDEVLERTTSAARELLGVRAPAVRHAPGAGLEFVAAPGMRARERSMLAILSCSARAALAATQRRDRERETQRATLRALEHMARHRDDETGEHLARVSAYVRLLATGLRETGRHAERLDDAFLEDLALAAPLHDIGKVAIPDSILRKPGKLTTEEYDEMKKHTIYGAKMLANAESRLLRLAAKVAIGHHERYDGTGYPYGLKGEQISLEARIVTVADVFDALSSKRVYKGEWTVEDALKYVEENSGKLFDPKVVQVLHEKFADVLAARDEENRRLIEDEAASLQQHFPPAEDAHRVTKPL